MFGVAVVDERALVVFVLGLFACVVEHLVVIVLYLEYVFFYTEHQRHAVSADFVLVERRFDFAQLARERHHLVDATRIVRLRA